MKFKELSKYWKAIIIILSILTVIFTLIFGGLVGFMANMRAENEVQRNASKKPDDELIGQRLVIKRKGKGDIHVNVYIPQTASDTKLPVLFNAHGGGFFLGDADEMDTQCDHWANDWNVIVVSINYTKLIQSRWIMLLPKLRIRLHILRRTQTNTMRILQDFRSSDIVQGDL